MSRRLVEGEREDGMMDDFTTDEIRMLAEMERRMDSGEQAYVVWHGHRASVEPECLEYFNLARGQTISDPIWMAILKWKVEDIKAKIAERDFHAAAQNPAHVHRSEPKNSGKDE